jgi:hypothetical protein
MTMLTYTESLTRAKLEAVGWKVITYPAYSFVLAPSDCHLFGK